MIRFVITITDDNVAMVSVQLERFNESPTAEEQAHAIRLEQIIDGAMEQVATRRSQSPPGPMH